MITISIPTALKVAGPVTAQSGVLSTGPQALTPLADFSRPGAITMFNAGHYDTGKLGSLQFYHAGNTISNPTAMFRNHAIGTIDAFAYDSATFQKLAYIEFATTENISPTNQGSKINFWVANSGAADLRIKALTINDFGIESCGVLSNSRPIGYSINSGGSITQNSTKSTPVNLNASTGKITLSNELLAANTSVSFTLQSVWIKPTDLLLLNHISGGTAGAYSLNAQCGNKTALITIRNLTAVDLSEAIVLRFAVISSTDD